MKNSIASTMPGERRRSTRWIPIVGLVAVASTLLLMGLLAAPPQAHAAEAPVGLGTAASYSVLGGQTVTNTGPTTLSGDLGVSPGTAVTGFPPGVVGGAVHAGDAAAAQAQSDLVIAYNDAAGRAPTAMVAGDLVGSTLTSGVYKSTGPISLSGTLTLDGQGNPDAVFIFQMASTLITASASHVTLINAAQACNVFWQVGSSATLGTNSGFVGTIMALTSITVNTGAVVSGRALARNGQVSLDDNVFTTPGCAPITTTTTPTGTTTTTIPTTTTATTTPTTTATTTTGTTTTGTTTTTTTPTGTTTTTIPTTTTATTTPTGTTTTTTGSTTTTIPTTTTTIPTTTIPTTTNTTTTNTTTTTPTGTITSTTTPTHTTTTPTHTTTSTTTRTTTTTTSTTTTPTGTTKTTTPTTTTTGTGTTTTSTTTTSTTPGGGGSGGGGGSNGGSGRGSGPLRSPSGPSHLAFTGASPVLGPMLGVGALLLVLGGLLLTLARSRTHSRKP